MNKVCHSVVLIVHQKTHFTLRSNLKKRPHLKYFFGTVLKKIKIIVLLCFYYYIGVTKK